MSCNCELLLAKIASLEATVAALKPIDENALIQKAITGSTNAILPKIPSDDRISQLGVAGVAATGLYAAKDDLLNLRLNYATKSEVKAVKAVADRADVTSENAKSKAAKLEDNLRSKADESRLAELETKNEANAAREALAKDVQAQVNEAKARASKALSASEQATKLAQEAESALAPVKAEVSSLSGKINKFIAEVGAEIERVVAPLRSGLGKLQGAVDGILGRITTILNELGVLQPLKRLIGLVGKLLWIIDIITAFVSFDTFATVKGLQVRVDSLEHNQDTINQDISDMLGRFGGLRAEVRRAQASAEKAINEADSAASDAASASDKAANALAKSLRAIDESGSASSRASSAISDARKAILDASNAADKASTASKLASDARSEISGVASGLSVANSKIDGLNSQLSGLRSGLEEVRGEAFGAEGLANQALSIGTGLLASYGVMKGAQALLGSRVSRVEGELQTIKNKPGIPGKDGRNGLDGKPGRDGKDGKDGLKGDRGYRGFPGLRGLRGLPGKDGRNGIDGKNGQPGRPGLDGKPGLNGRNGLDGKPGQPGIDGKNGINGRDGRDVNPADLAAINAKLDRNYGEIKATHIEATGANQKATFIQRSIAGLNTFVVTNFATTIQLIKNFSGSFERFAKWAHLDRVLGVINLAANLHNALMLSTNLGQSLMSLISNSLNALGLGLKDKDGHSLDLGALINGSIEALVIKVVGRDNYTQASSFIKATSAIYQAAMNGVYAISAMVDATRNIAEIGASYTGKIGNALKKSGAIFEHSFGWMNENLNATTATSTRWENFFSKIDDTANAVQSLDMVAGSVVSIKDSVTQLKQTREEYNTAHKQAEDSIAGKAAESKLESQAPVTLLDAHIGKAE
jgi:hypothetical protein